MNSLRKKTNNRGQVMIITLVLFVAVSALIISGLIGPTVRNIKNSSDLFNSKRSFYLSDSALGDSVYRVKNNLRFGGTNLVSLDNLFATTTILDDLGGKIITSIGNNSNYFRNLETKVTAGEGVSFSYGIQVGNGGFVMTGSSRVNGSVYSSGSINGCSSCVITGTAISAGPSGLITGEGQWNRFTVGTGGVGDAWAHTVNYTNAAGLIKCQSGTYNNKSCISSADPALVDMPVPDDKIADWKADALLGGTYTGNYSVGGNDKVSLGPKVITGDLNVGGSGELTMTGTLYVKGKIIVDGSAKIKLSSTYGSNAGIIVSDGRVEIGGSASVQGTGSAGSFILMATNSTCDGTACGGEYAIKISGSVGAVVLNAQKGTLYFSGSAHAKEATANKIIMPGSTVIDYDTGLINPNFVTGPAGGYTVTKYKETE
ncbi:MAG: hypothetical protein WCO10_01560 [bacterium]